MKKALAALMALLMALSLAACGSGSSPAPAAATNPDSGSAPAATAAPAPAKKTTITYMVTGDVPTNKTMTDVLPKVNELLGAKFNAELNVKWIEWTDYLSKYNLELASQDGNLDLIGTATDWLDAWPNTQRGAFLPLSEEMLKANAPLTYAQVPADHWDLCKYDGQIYLLPEDNFAQWTNHGFMYRGDWAKEAGLANGVHSWDQLGQYFGYVKSAKPDTIPWDAKPDASLVAQLSGGWLASHTKNIYIEGLRVDLFFGNSASDPYTVSNYFLEGSEFENFAKNQKAWSDAGYWKEDVLNNTTIDTRQEMHEALSGADQHHSMTYYGGEAKRMEEYQPGSDLGFFWFGEEQGNVVSLNITHGAMAIAARSKSPELALQIYDYIRNDPEAYHLFNYGIEGQQYVLAADGKTYTRPEGFVEDTDGAGFNYWWGRNDDLEFVGPLTDIPKKEILEAEYDKVSIVYPYGKAVFNLDSISAELDNLSNLYNTYMPQIVYGKAADPVAYVAEFREKLKTAGYEKCIAEVNAQLAATYK